MDALLIAVPLLLLVCLFWWFVRKRAPAAASRADDADRLDTIAAWPPQPTRVLTSQERALHQVLTRAMPDHLVLSQVPLSRFLKVPKRHSYSEWLRRLGYQSVDFVVCDMTSAVVAVVELQPTANEVNDRARKRLTRIQRTLKAADIPFFVWTESNLPNAEAARAALLPKVAEPASAPMPMAMAAAAVPRMSAEAIIGARPPARGANPFDEVDRDSTQDELIEAPPSTWFDDLDSGPTPLQTATRTPATSRR